MWLYPPDNKTITFAWDSAYIYADYYTIFVEPPLLVIFLLYAIIFAMTIPRTVKQLSLSEIYNCTREKFACNGIAYNGQNGRSPTYRYKQTLLYVWTKKTGPRDGIQRDLRTFQKYNICFNRSSDNTFAISSSPARHRITYVTDHFSPSEVIGKGLQVPFISFKFMRAYIG